MRGEPQVPTDDDSEAWAEYRARWREYAEAWHNGNPTAPQTDDVVGGWPTYYAAWGEHWTTAGTPWRTEPEIDDTRQQFLAERRAVTPNIEQGLYPFRDETGSVKLDRADVEWLLATHDSGGLRGPVDWGDVAQRERQGIDIRGADLRDADLDRLPLARTRGALDRQRARVATRRQRRMALVSLDRVSFYGAHLEEAELGRVHLCDADLSEAHLQRTYLYAAHLESANLTDAHLGGAELTRAFLDPAVWIHRTVLSDSDNGGMVVADMHWGGANLATAEWAALRMLGDERLARQAKRPTGKRKDKARRLREYERAVRANRQLATALREQGLNEQADYFAYRAQVLQRQVLRRQGHPFRTVFSWFLDLLAGHGFKPGRTIIAYLLAILAFATAYYFLGQSVGPHLSPLGAFVFSMTSFHGRGFFPGGIALDDPITVLAAFEAFVGLVIEVSFIATFTQRFFAR